MAEECYLVYECNSMCNCNKTCPNRVLQNGVQVKLELFKTENKGWAVRVGEPILRGTFVCELIGEVLDELEANKTHQPNLVNYQVLVDNMDSQHAHIGLYAIRDYDFPRQEVVIEFVLDAIQAEAFNPKTLFLIGSYTIVARVLRRKVYVPASKCHILKCIGISEEDMQWFTLNEQESHIHVVPMWMLASFKRLKHVAN
ncbi:hypothetical protein ACFE04_030655 [Oxalis oulophora]